MPTGRDGNEHQNDSQEKARLGKWRLKVSEMGGGGERRGSK